MAESDLGRDFLETVIHKLHIGEFLEFSEDKNGRKMFPPERITLAKMERQEKSWWTGELITGSLGLGWRVDKEMVSRGPGMLIKEFTPCPQWDSEPLKAI